MKMIKKVLLSSLLGGVVLILLVELILQFGGDPLSRWVVNKFNDRQPGQAYIDGFRASLLFGLPSIRMQLEDFTYFEHSETERLPEERPILKFADFKVGINPFKLLAGEVKITRLSLDTGYVQLVRHPDSTVNLFNALGPLIEIQPSIQETLPDTQTVVQRKDFEFVLKKLNFQSLGIRIDDQVQKRGLDFLMNNWQHRLVYRSKVIKNQLHVKGELLNLWIPADTILHNYPLQLSSAFKVNRENYSAKVQESKVGFGPLNLKVQGSYDHLDSSFVDIHAALDLRDPELLPWVQLGLLDSNILTNQIYGHVYAKGDLSGRLRAELPKINAAFTVDSLSFNDWEGEPLVYHAEAKGRFLSQATDDLSNATVQLDLFDLKTVLGIIQGQASIEDLTAPKFDLELTGKNDLEHLEKFVKIQPLEALKGNLEMEFALAGQYFPRDSFGLELDKAEGFLKLAKLGFTVPSQNLIIHSADVEVKHENNQLVLRKVSIQANNSDLTSRGVLSNVLPYYFGQPVNLKGNLEVTSNTLLWSDFISDPFLLSILDPKLSNSLIAIAFEGDGDKRIKGRLLPAGYIEVKRLHTMRSNSPDIRQIRGRLVVDPNAMQVDQLTGVVGQSDFSLQAALDNYYAYRELNVSNDITLRFRAEADRMRAEDFLVVNGKFLGPENYRDEIMRNFYLDGYFTFNNQEIAKKRRLPNSTFAIESLSFDLSLFPTSVFDLSMQLNRRDNTLELEKLKGIIGDSDIVMKGYLTRHQPSDELGSFAMSNYESALEIRSQYVNLDELLAINNNTIDPSTQPLKNNPTESEKEAIIDQRLSSYNIFAQPFPQARYQLQVDSITLLKKGASGLQGTFSISSDQQISLNEVAAQLGAGRVIFNGRIDASDPNQVELVTKARFEESDLRKLRIPFIYDSTTYIIADHFGGIMNSEMEFSIQLTPELAFDVQDAVGTIDFQLSNGEITDFDPILIIADFLGTKDLNNVRVDDLSNSMTLREGTLDIPLMDLNSSIGAMRMAGYQKVNGEMEYLFQIPLGLMTDAAWNYLTGKERKEDAEPDEIERVDDASVFINVRVMGTIDDYKIKLGKGKSFKEMVREARQYRKAARKAAKQDEK